MDEFAPIVYDLSAYKEETQGWDKDSTAYLNRYYTKQYYLAETGRTFGANPATEPQHNKPRGRGKKAKEAKHLLWQQKQEAEKEAESTSAQADTAMDIDVSTPTSENSVSAQVSALGTPEISETPSAPSSVEESTTTTPLLPPASRNGSYTPPSFVVPKTGVRSYRGDQFVYQIPNKLCVIGLAPSHPLILQPELYRPISIKFPKVVMSQLPRPTATPATSKKQTPPPCNPDTVICSIKCIDFSPTATPISLPDANSESSADKEGGDGSGSLETSTLSSSSTNPPICMFDIRACIWGHIIEINERLLDRDREEEKGDGEKGEITDPATIETLLTQAATHGFVAIVRPKIDNPEVALKDCTSADAYSALLVNTVAE